jgi:lipopolysaccharide transport system permease protein
MTDYELVIKPSKRLTALHLRELWEYRELFYFLIWRDVKIRYKQTVLGAAWAILRPVVSMVVFTFIFNKIAGFSVEGIPYQLFTFSGILAWSFFSEGLTGGSQSLVGSANLISKVYFPRLIIPAAAVLRGLVDFSIALAIFVGFTIYYQYPFTANILLFPFVLIWGMATSLGFALLFSAIGVKYRDIAHALPYVVQILLWVSPVGYSSAKIPAHLEFFYWLNPMTGVIESFRYTLLGKAHLPPHLLLMSICLTVIIFIAGLITFRGMEKEFADVI